MYHGIMQKKSTFKIRIHGLDIPKTVYVVKADNHIECYKRFSGLITNRGFFNSRSSWNSYKFRDVIHKTLTTSSTIAYPKNNDILSTRSYYFLPNHFRGTSLARSRLRRTGYELVLEVIKIN